MTGVIDTALGLKSVSEQKERLRMKRGVWETGSDGQTGGKHDSDNKGRHDLILSSSHQGPAAFLMN